MTIEKYERIWLPIDMQQRIYLFDEYTSESHGYVFGGKQDVYPGPTETGKRSITRRHSC